MASIEFQVGDIVKHKSSKLRFVVLDIREAGRDIELQLNSADGVGLGSFWQSIKGFTRPGASKTKKIA